LERLPSPVRVAGLSGTSRQMPSIATTSRPAKRAPAVRIAAVPSRKLTQPLLGRAVLGEDGIDHVERHDLG